MVNCLRIRTNVRKKDMRFGYTILYVQDVPQAVDFYERAFGMTRKFIADDATYGEMASGDTTLSFAAHAMVGELIPGGYRRNDPADQPLGMEIGLVTDDVPAAWETALAAGAKPVCPSATKPWGQTVAYVRDLDGMLVELCTPINS